MDKKITRFNQRKESFERTLKLLLRQSKKEVVSDENIGATLHFFEMSFELAWKVLKDLLEVNGIIAKSPRDTIKNAFQQEYISDGHVWLQMLDARNSIAHAYEEAMAHKLFTQIRHTYLDYLKEIEALECTD